jgi:cysteinyl-tRNA synthetase
VAALLEARERARADREYAEADRLRAEIAALGWEVRDGPTGPELLPGPA